MNSVQEQSLHLQWFPTLLRTALAWGVKAELRTLSASGGSADFDFDRRRFFQLSDLGVPKAAKLFSFNTEILLDESLEFLRNTLSPADVIIGYELSDATRSALHRASLTYVDIWLHPVRFYDDIMFAFGSNRADIRRRLEVFDLDRRKLTLRATEIRVQMARSARHKTPTIPPGSIVFVGQTQYDKALLRDGKMLSLLDFRERFEALCKQGSSVLYSRHPHVHSGDAATMRYLRQFENVSHTKVPVYELLAHPNVRAVYSISSSVVQEAQYFGKESTYFFKPPVPLTPDGRGERYVSVLDDFLTPQFWAHVLEDYCGNGQVEPLRLSPKTNRLRHALGTIYGFHHVDRYEDLYNRAWWMRDLRGTVLRRARAVILGLLKRR